MKAYATKRSSTGGREYLSITILPDLSKDGYSREQISIGAETKSTDTTWGYSTQINTYGNECYSLVICKAIVSILEKAGRNSLEHINPVDLVETLNQLKYKKVCYHEGMGHYYTQKDWPEGLIYRLDIGDKFEKTFAGKTEAEALKQARKYVLNQLEYSSAKKWLDWIAEPKVEFYKCGQNYYESSVQPGNTMNLDRELINV